MTRRVTLRPGMAVRNRHTGLREDIWWIVVGPTTRAIHMHSGLEMHDIGRPSVRLLVFDEDGEIHHGWTGVDDIADSDHYEVFG